VPFRVVVFVLIGKEIRVKTEDNSVERVLQKVKERMCKGMSEP
jgi:hypothetical protein